MGEIPSWYLVVRAAKYLGVPPWDLMDQPRVWQEIALEAEAAELRQKNGQKRSETRGNRISL